MSSWRVAKSLLALRAQINAAAPNRSKASDGTIGNTAHFNQGSASDHNPWVKDSHGTPVVTGMDITHDPVHGCDVWTIAQAIVASRDKRLKYFIYTGGVGGKPGICSSSVSPWTWRTRSVDDHGHHLHISVDSNAADYDAVGAWRIAFTPVKMSHPAAATGVAKSNPALVKALQRSVNVPMDGKWGDGTQRALDVVRYFAFHNRLPWGVKSLQRSVGAKQDGAMGPATKLAVVTAVRSIQSSLNIGIDGRWGKETEAAFIAAYRTNFKRF